MFNDTGKDTIGDYKVPETTADGEIFIPSVRIFEPVAPSPASPEQIIEELKQDPKVMAQIKQGMKERREGKVVSWDDVKLPADYDFSSGQTLLLDVERAIIACDKVARAKLDEILAILKEKRDG